MGEPAFQTTTRFVRSLSEALRALRLFDRVLPLVPPTTRRSLEAPDGRPAHDGALPLHVSTALADDRLIEEVFLAQTQRTLGPVTAPLVKGALALAGSSPAVAFGHLDQVLRVLNQGVSAAWESSSPTSGLITLTYPASVNLDRFAACGWVGALRHAYALCNTEGTTRAAASLGRIVKVEASWQTG